MTLRVYFSNRCDPMITDTVDGLNSIALRTRDFLKSSDEGLVLHADISGSPAPYDAFLPAVEFEKRQSSIVVTRLDRGGLHIAGSPENLKIWCNHFVFPLTATDGHHHHPDQVHRSEYVAAHSIPIIIEVRDEE
jgi:hypothetical protein